MAEAYTPLPVEKNTRDCLRVLPFGRTGQGKSTTGNKLLKAGGESVLRDYDIREFDIGGGEDSCTAEIRAVYRRETQEARAVQVVDIPGFADSNRVERLGAYKAMQSCNVPRFDQNANK